MKKPLHLILLFLGTFLSILSQKSFSQQTIGFNDLITNQSLGRSFLKDGFIFSISSLDPNNNDIIPVVPPFNLGFQNSIALSNTTDNPNPVTRWRISTQNGLEFRLLSIFLNSNLGSSSGTIRGIKDGQPTGLRQDLDFNGLKDFPDNPDFYNVDAIEIEGINLRLFVDEFTHGPALIVQPSISSATYNASTGHLVVTGAGFLNSAGASNDVVANRIRIRGQGNSSYTLTDTPNADITSTTAFTLTLSATDRLAISSLLNRNGTLSLDSNFFNLEALEDWLSGVDPAFTIADLLNNPITVSGIPENPLVTSVTSITDDGLYREGDEISIQVIFDQAVEANTIGGSPTLILETGSVDRAASYVDGSGTTTLNFSYTVQAGDASNDLDYASVNALIFNGAVIVNSTNDPASLVLPALGSANSISGQKNLVIDTAIPVIISVLVPANGVYRIDQNLDFAVSFSEAVVVSGAPQLSLTIGASTAQASYLSGSGSNFLVFRYTVQSGDLDLNGITVGTLSLNTGTIQDAAENNANLTLNSVGSTSQVLVDGVRPFVESLSLSDNSLAIGQTATLTVAFSERISGLEIADFTVANGTLSGLTSADGGETWTATFTPTSNVQDATNVISLDNEGYTDLAGNSGTGTTESFNYEIDTQRPIATIVVDDTELTSGETSLVTITFTEAVTGLMLDDFTVENGILSDLESVDGGITWTATLTPDLSVEDATNVIQLDNTGYQDLAGNTGSGTTESNDYLVDTQTPLVITQNIAVELNSSGEISITPAQINNGSTDSFGIGSLILDKTNFDCSNVGTNTVLLTVTDENGNEATGTATVTVNDNTGPEIRGKNITVTLNDFGIVIIFPSMVDDGSSDACGIAGSSISPSIFREDNAGVNNVTYTVTDINGNSNSVTVQVTVLVAPKVLDVVVNEGQGKIYGEDDPEFTFEATGFEGSDDASILTGALEREIGEDVGTYEISLGTLDAGPNYIINLVEADFTITPAFLYIMVGRFNKVYGAEDPDFTYTPVGFKRDDTASILEGSLSRTEGEDVGSYQFNLGTLTAGANYSLQLSSDRPLLISPAPLRIIADDKQRILNTANPPLTFTYDGLVNGDTQIQVAPTLETTATETSPVGSYPITLNGGSDPNYSISRVNGILTVGRKTVTITASDQSKEYGEANPVLTFSYNGLFEGDTQIQNEPTITTTATINSNVGSYDITLNGGSDPNYEVILVNGTLTVGPKAVMITADDQSKVYGAANPPLTFSYAGLVNGDTGVAIEPSIVTSANESSNVGTYPITLSGGTDPNYAITLVNGTLSVTPASLTITADDQSKIYGDANPALTFTYDGLVNGDTQIQTEPIINTTATENSPVGSYPITLTDGSDPNYSISRVNGTLTIGQKTVTITADDQIKVYGQANPVLTFSYNGLLEGDTQIQTEPILSTEATISSPVGSYEISLSGGSDPNYDFTLVNGTLSVIPASLMITADDKQKIYGEANPALTFSYAGFVNGDTQISVEPSITTTATASSNVGIFPITLTGGEDGNYAITLVNGTLTVGQKAVTIIAEDQSKEYGATNPVLTFSYDGLVNGDTQPAVEPTISTTATQGSNVGTYPITLSGGSDQNYAITLVNGTLTVGQKALTITADDKQKIYGEANPALTFSYAGLVNGDTQITTEPSIATTVMQASNAGTYPITLSGGSDTNYAITLVNGTLTVGQKALTITADDKQKIYGEANPALTFTYLGLVNGDTQITTEPSIATTATQGSNVGTYPITLSGGSDQNYAITLVNGTLTIVQKALIITADDKQKVYGEANPALTFSYAGLVNGDTQITTEPSIATTATQGSNVGTYPITLSGGSDQNYAITLINGTITIGQKALTITADAKSKVYGEANPALTFAYSGLVNGDAQITTEPSIATTATAGSNVGTYPIILSGGSDQNYAITLVNGTLTVNPAALKITADAKSKIFGNIDPALTFTASGFKLSDTEAVLTGSLTRALGETVGIYDISLGTLDAGANYEIDFQGSSLEIVPAQLAEILTGGDITTPWSVDPVLPNQVDVLTQDGQILSYDVVWDISTLNVLKRGTYTVFGTVSLPVGILNPSGQKAVLSVIVLPKPAPTDLILSNNSFIPDPSVFFQEIGFFTVIDGFDDIHTVELVPGAADNSYFEINSDILFWSSAEEAAGVTEFAILVRVTDRDGNVIEKSFTITRDRKDIADIDVFNTFSPNGDGVNDTWGVPDLKYFAGGRVQVFDRSGQRVFYTESPSVRWDGTFEGKELPVGAYFWILESRETGEVRRGVLNLLRQ